MREAEERDMTDLIDPHPREQSVVSYDRLVGDRWTRIEFRAVKEGDLWDGALIAWAEERAKRLQTRGRPAATSAAHGSSPAHPGTTSTRRQALDTHRASGALTQQQDRVLELIGRDRRDSTRQELARDSGMGINVICARVNELLELGRVRVARRRRCAITGQEVEALVLVQQMELAA
jgi:hypothetical protein